MAGIIKVNQYQDFNGNTLFTSDGNGNLTTQNLMYPSFHAHSATTSLSNATHTTVLFSTKERDTNNLYDASTGKFTVTSSTTGYYYFYATIGTEVITANRIQVNLMKNGTANDNRLATCETQSDTSGYPAPNISRVIPLLSSGDFVMVQAYQNSGATKVLDGQDNKNFFGAYRIGS